VVLLQSTSKYPVSLQEVGLNVLAELRDHHGCPVGLSIHSPTLWPAVAAMTLGAELVEVHVALHRRVFGPDTVASLTVEQLVQLVEARDAIAEMRTHPVDKDAVARDLAPMRQLFTKSLAPRTGLRAGTLLEASSITTKKPGTGIPPEELETVLGKRLRRDVPADRLLRREDLDG
jgi:N-acetylneuraminate synthase